MTARSKHQLAMAVLREMGLVANADEPAAEDLARIIAVYEQKLEEWRERRVVFWDNTEAATVDIPLVVFEPLVSLVVNAVEHEFGRNVRSTLERELDEVELLRDLRRHTAQRSAGRPIRVAYF
ncbi:MAG: hypothetical protein ACR2PG_06270 [Hyphomicrobiaceae bacterium]